MHHDVYTENAASPAPRGRFIGARMQVRECFSRLSLSPEGWLGLIGLALVAALALLAPLIAHDGPFDMVAMPTQWPGQTPDHWFGTDMLGRDMGSQLVYGARVSLRIGLEAGLLAAALGWVIGSVAGYIGGWIDNLAMRIAELFQIMPSLLLVLAFVIISGPTVTNIVWGVALTAWPNVARLARGEARRIRKSEFIEAAQVMGMRDVQIIAVYVLPNTAMPVVAMLAMLVGHAILLEATVAFLGLGDPNVMSWGSMIGQGRDEIRTAWYMTAEPGLAIVFTVSALGLLGTAINTRMNPRGGRLQ